jgi:hypothetical protein
MFIGHFGAGLGAKSVAPRVSLGALFAAAQLADLLWPTLLLLGVERVVIAPGITRVTPLDFVHYPISHSLLMLIGWGALFAVGDWAWRRDRRGAAVLGVLVVSHWGLDLVVHRPDLPLWPGGATRLGLGAWDSLPLTVLLELAALAGGLALYRRATRAVDRVGSVGLWGLVAFLLLIEAGNLVGPPPPSVEAIAWVGQAQWLLVLWGWWVDRHRESR